MCRPPTYIYCCNSDRKTICRPYVCMCVVHRVRKRNGLSLFSPPTLAQLADWLRADLHLIMRWLSVGSCCCLLILSFTYNRHVLFTNRIQNSRCFIMSLLCVLTNAAGRLPWLPQCRLLPRLERTACPATWGTHMHRNKNDFSSVPWI